MGYSSPVIHLKFPELVDDYDADPVWVTIRNPKLMTASQLQPRDVKRADDGTPDSGDAIDAMHELFAKLVVAWRVYPGDVDVDPDTGEPLEQETLRQISKSEPATPDLVALLPQAISNKIASEVSTASNPTS